MNARGEVQHYEADDGEKRGGQSIWLPVQQQEEDISPMSDASRSPGPSPSSKIRRKPVPGAHQRIPSNVTDDGELSRKSTYGHQRIPSNMTDDGGLSRKSTHSHQRIPSNMTDEGELSRKPTYKHQRFPSNVTDDWGEQLDRKASDHMHLLSVPFSKTAASESVSPPSSRRRSSSWAGLSPVSTPGVEVPMSHGWRPSYLRRRALISFVVVFLLLAGTIEVLFALSRRDRGLVSTDSKLFILWTFGPTTVLTVLVGLWTRVEFQAMRYMPWIVLGRGDAYISQSDRRRASQTLFLDYPNMWAPKAVLAAIENRHYLVVASVLTSTLMRVLVVLSTGMLRLQDVPKTVDGVSITLRGSFVTAWTESTSPFTRTQDAHPYVVMMGIAQANLSYPEGNLPGVAFQTFDTPKLDQVPGVGYTANITSTVVNVDGVYVNLTCEIPKITGEFHEDAFVSQYFLDMESSLCGNKVSYVLDTFQSTDFETPYYWIYDDLDFARKCANNDSLAFTGLAKMKVPGQNRLEMLASAGIVCKVDFIMTEMQAIRTHEGIEVSETESANKKVIDGDVLTMIRSSRLGGRSEDGAMISGENYLQDGSIPTPIKLAAHLTPGGPPPISKLLDPAALQETMSAYFKTFGPLAAHYKIRQQDSTLRQGAVNTGTSRLVVQEGNAQAMAAILCVMAILAIPMVFQAAPKNGIVPRDPNPISGTAAILSNSKSILSRLKGSGAKDLSVVYRRLPGSYYTAILHRPSKVPPKMFQLKQLGPGPIMTDPKEGIRKTDQVYTPWTLQLSARLGGISFIVTLLVLLWILLMQAMTHNGIIDVESAPYSHFLWTALPTALFVCLSLYLNLCDFDIRSLAPFAKLTGNGGSYTETLTTQYTNEVGFTTLYKAATSRDWAVFLSKLVALLAALMPIFTSSLFSASNQTQDMDILIQQETWFTSSSSEPASMASLILNENLAYPRWTYEDLAFPEFTATDGVSLPSFNDTGIWARLPATRANLECQILTPPNGNISDMYCPGYSPDTQGACVGDNYYGYVSNGCREVSSNYTHPAFVTYVWGQCNGAYDKGFKTLHYLACNESFTELDVDVNLVGPDLDISADIPPIPDLESQKETAIELKGMETMYQLLYIDGASNELDDLGLLGYDDFFGTLVTSRFAVLETLLGSDEGVDTVIAAIKRQHGIIRAQGLSSGNGTRLRFDNSSASELRSESPPAIIPAVLTYTSYRLTQNTAPTFILAALLAIILIINALSLFVTPRTVVPKCPGSIAAMVSLLADSTLFWHMPDGAEWLADDEIARNFEGKRFRMDWFWANKSGGVPEKNFTIGIVEDEGVKVRYELEGDTAFSSKHDVSWSTTGV